MQSVSIMAACVGAILSFMFASPYITSKGMKEVDACVEIPSNTDFAVKLSFATSMRNISSTLGVE